jgi:outer membrane receptor protein involved in Fe transport
MFFAQDDWKVNSKLSVNLGLRYDFITPALEAENHQLNFNPAGSGSVIQAKDGSLEDRGLVKPDRNNFAPRVGFVYKIDDRCSSAAATGSSTTSSTAWAARTSWP